MSNHKELIADWEMVLDAKSKKLSDQEKRIAELESEVAHLKRGIDELTDEINENNRVPYDY